MLHSSLSSLRSRRTLILALSAFLSGCAVTAEDCDPRNSDMGLGTKLGCSSRGVYAERIKEKEQTLLDEQQANQMFRDVYTALEQEKLDVGKQRNQQQARYDALNRSLSKLLGEIKDKAKGNQKIEQKIAEIEKNIAKLQKEESPSVLQKRHELQKLQDQIMALESDLGLR